jgi:hypothetical protein
MAVPSSGPLGLRADIALEIDGSATGSDVSLNTLSSQAGFTAPNGMEEFYGYSSAVAPTVSTSAISNVSYNTLRANGNVSNDGGATVTQRGFYIGTSSNYASNTKYSSGSGTGSYNYTLSVSASTTYYATAYAINSVGESVGSTVNATTGAQPVAISGYYDGGSSIGVGGNQGPFYGAVNFGSMSVKWKVNQTVPSSVMVGVTGGTQVATGMAGWNSASAGYHSGNPINYPGSPYRYFWQADGTASASGCYVNSSRMVYGYVYAAGNYSLTMTGSRPLTLHIY